MENILPVWPFKTPSGKSHHNQAMELLVGVVVGCVDRAGSG